MDLVQTLVLALLQGLTEFLPISSSAHLILLPKLLGWPDQGLMFDVAVHVGTLAAVLWYFRVDIKQLVLAWFADVFTGVRNPHSRLAWAVIAGYRAHNTGWIDRIPVVRRWTTEPVADRNHYPRVRFGVVVGRPCRRPGCR